MLDRVERGGTIGLSSGAGATRGAIAFASLNRAIFDRSTRIAAPTPARKPRKRFHDLRHSAALLLIAKGVELVEVSMLLGHSEIRVTSDLYTHLVKQTSSKATRSVDAVLSR